MQRRFMFLTKFFTSPKEIGSITPSSSFLTKKMFQEVKWENVHTIIELGAGTGVFTEHIFKQLPAQSKALIIEQDKQMRKKLQERYPNFNFGENAESLQKMLDEFKLPHADYIISGLPFTNIEASKRKMLISSIKASLKPGGTFIAFQYSLHMKKYFSENFQTTCVRFVFLNLPPAFVYVCTKKIEKV